MRFSDPTLKRKTAIVTGASSGLGWATVTALVASGANVVATARRSERLAALKAETGCEVFTGDAADAAVNNAGIGNYKQLIETSDADFDDLVRSNLRSSFLFSRAVAPGMIERRSGTIVFVSSVAGVAGAANESVYSATKFAQVGFAQSLDQELFPYGIKVTALIAGGMKTEFAIGKGRNADAIAASPMMDPADVAQAVLFVCAQPPGVRLPTLTVRHMGVRK
jgi:NADP-dependent 3-hydroxy acid dehydrogenase YdfG